MEFGVAENVCERAIANLTCLQNVILGGFAQISEADTVDQSRRGVYVGRYVGTMP